MNSTFKVDIIMIDYLEITKHLGKDKTIFLKTVLIWN